MSDSAPISAFPCEEVQGLGEQNWKNRVKARSWGSGSGSPSFEVPTWWRLQSPHDHKKVPRPHPNPV